MEPNKALVSGCCYHATPQDYLILLCALKYTQKQILTITWGKTYNCVRQSFDLNYPWFIALYNNKRRPIVHKFRRTMTNVGSGIATHRAKVTQPKGSVVILSPERLTFRYKNIINFIFELIYYSLEKITYTISVLAYGMILHRITPPLFFNSFFQIFVSKINPYFRIKKWQLNKSRLLCFLC